MNKDGSPQLSIVIPVYNEAESVAELHQELIATLQEGDRSFEIIFVDDGSKDGTFEALSKLSPAMVIRLSRNFGKSQALQAGFDAARGEHIITMDGDLQDDPKEIPNFLKAIHEKRADLVVGWKRRRLDPENRKLASRIANAVTGALTGVKVHDMNCCFKIYTRDAAKSLALYGDMHRFIPALIGAMGYLVEEMPVNHRARQYGTSKYGIGRLAASLFDFCTLIFLRRFTDRPMHFFGAAGFIVGLVGFFTLAYLTVLKLITGALIGDRPLLLLGVLLMLLGVQLLSLGFLGELVIRRAPRGERPFVIREERSNP